MKPRKNILFVLESRATYGYAKNVINELKNWENLEFKTLITGMHLLDEMGGSIEEIKADGLRIDFKVQLKPEGLGRSSWAKGMGKAMPELAQAIDDADPDIVMIFGDRAETLMACITVAYMGIPIAHVQAGDKSGHIDDAARYAIAKLSHIHFASCNDSKQRLQKLGEQEFRIFDTGAPQLDDMDGSFAWPDHLPGLKNIKDEKFIMLVMHPLFVERSEAYQQIQDTYLACESFGLPIVWIYPNNDLGYDKIIEFIDSKSSQQNTFVFKNLARHDYLALLQRASVLVGNSSSGILEAPSYQTPVVNIGDRQRGRLQAANILNSDVGLDEVKQAIDTALNSEGFRDICSQSTNPYGDGRASERICGILDEVNLDKKLIDKVTIY